MAADSKSPALPGADDTRIVEAVVVANLCPDVAQVRALTHDGVQCVLTPATPGVELDDLSVGMRLLCTVTRRLPRVLHARLLA